MTNVWAACEITDKARNSVYGYDRYVLILNEGTER